MPRLAQPVVDLVGVVEVGVVDEALPSDRRPRLLEIDPHHDAQIGRKLADGRLQQAGVLAGGIGVVNGTGPGEHQEARIAAGQDLGDLAARLVDGRARSLRFGKLFLKLRHPCYQCNP